MKLHLLFLFFFGYVAVTTALQFPNRFPTSDIDIDAELKHAEELLRDAAAQFVNATGKIKEFRSSLDEVVPSARDLRHGVEAVAKEYNITLEDISARLSKELNVVFQNIKSEFSEPLPEDQDERYKYRAQKISSALLQVRAAFTRVSSSWGMSEQDANIWFDNVEPHLSKILNTTGLLIDRHPDITRAILVAGAVIIIPEGWILRPMFNLFGFSRLGPVKGSLAAAAQRFFWGGAVKKGSWFSWFQSVGAKMLGNFRFVSKLLCALRLVRC